jgi:rRNA processing protein Krr1/Pno1
MAGVLESLAQGLRQAGGVISPAASQVLNQENMADEQARRQQALLMLQDRLQGQREQARIALEAQGRAADRASREGLAADAAKRDLLKFEQGMDFRRDQLNFQRDQALRTARTAEERLALDKQYKEQVLRLQEQGLEMKKLLARGTNQQIVGNEGKLRDDYNQLSKTFILVRDAHQRVMASANDPSAAGDLALIFNYMKVLDPTSVVRESEFAQAAQTGAFGERIKAAVQKVISGERLSDATRRDFLDRSERLYQAAEQNQSDLENRFKGISERSGVNPENVIIPYRTSKPKKKEEPKPQAPTASPNAVDFKDLK